VFSLHRSSDIDKDPTGTVSREAHKVQNVNINCGFLRLVSVRDCFTIKFLLHSCMRFASNLSNNYSYIGSSNSRFAGTPLYACTSRHRSMLEMYIHRSTTENTTVNNDHGITQYVLLCACAGGSNSIINKTKQIHSYKFQSETLRLSVYVLAIDPSMYL